MCKKCLETYTPDCQKWLALGYRVEENSRTGNFNLVFEFLKWTYIMPLHSFVTSYELVSIWKYIVKKSILKCKL